MSYTILPQLATNEELLTFCNYPYEYEDNTLINIANALPNFVEGAIYINPFMTSLQVGESKIWHLQDGIHFIELKRESGTSSYSIYLKDSNSNIIGVSSGVDLNTGSMYYSKHYFAFLITQNKAIAVLFQCLPNNRNRVGITSIGGQYSDEFKQNLYSILMNSQPIIYNYEPINYITGNNKTLKLSMIKAESTANGEIVMNGELSDIQRFTDTTDLYEIAKRMTVGQEVNLGYTSDNNYVTLTLTSTSTMAQGETAYYTTLKYYLRGLHQATLDCELPYMYITEPNEVYSKLYYTLLLDTEHSACRQSVITVTKASDVPPDYIFNLIENTRGLNADSVQSLMFTWLADGYSLTDTNDPYDYGGTSSSDTGNGTWDNSSENIDIPTIPSVSISDTGFVSVFNPTLTQVKALADYMWSGAFDVSLFKKVMANPMDSIIGFALIPCEPSVSGVDTVKVGNIDTGVSMNAVSNQFVDVDCGLLELQEYWGNYLDYSPYTKITLILPFIGAVHLNPDDCMNKTIGIKYRIDILSGGCVAYITCNGSVMYQFTGSCSAQLPITNLDYRGMISALVSIGTTAVGVGSAIASGGITAPMVAVGVGNTANNVMNGKPNIQHGGSLGSTSGFLGTRIPYLIITRPRQCVPTNVNKFKGLPSLITSKLKNVTGFTQVHDIHLDLLPCSDEEKIELKGLLESGVII